MTSHSDFRTQEEEVTRLLEECVELRRTLKSISSQVGRMENRLKLAFPGPAAQVHERHKRSSGADKATVTPEQAMVEFDEIVQMAASGQAEQAQRRLETRSAADLLLLARELGVSLAKSKPSIALMREAILGKVRESVLLSQHSHRGSSE